MAFTFQDSGAFEHAFSRLPIAPLLFCRKDLLGLDDSPAAAFVTIVAKRNIWLKQRV